jgi:hypothetical protein
MNEHVEVAPAEIERVGTWALRGLGMPFGVADRAAPLLGWATAVEKGALRVLREQGQIIERGSRSLPQRWQIGPQHWVIGSKGRSMLEMGPVSVDLLTFSARNMGVGRVDIIGTPDPIFMSAVCRLGAKRNLVIVAQSIGEGLILGGREVSAIGAYPRPPGSALFAEERNPSNALSESDLGGLLERQNIGALDVKSMISLFAYAKNPTREPTKPPIFPIDLEQKFAAAKSKGVSVDKRDLANLYDLEVRCWAPTSERSRRQALI